MSSNIYPCTKCGKKITRKGKLCIACSKTQRKSEAIGKGRKIRARVRKPKAVVPKLKINKCTSCGKDMFQYGMCSDCAKNRERGVSYKVHPIVVNICSKSPTKAHHWSIDSDHKGLCLYCKQTKDFSTKDEKR